MAKRNVKIGYLGPDTSTFGYQALEKAFTQVSTISRDRPNPIPFSNHQAICEAVGKMTVKYGVVAIENAIDGVVAETVRSIESVASHLGIAICGEVTVPIELFYMKRDADGALPRRLLSHQTALGQCREFVSTLQSKGVIVEVRSSTGQAAEEAARDPDTAALASSRAQKKYGLQLINQQSVVDHKNSVTRFLILSKQHAKKTQKNKTCFLVNLQQSDSGVLHKTLGVFASHGIAVLLVYPSPILGRCWEYTFLLEVAGHVDDAAMDKAWYDFRKLGISLQPMRFLGSYADTTSV